MNRLILAAITLLALACGGSGSSGPQVGVVNITQPASNGAYQTDQALITLAGNSFLPAKTATDYFGCSVLTDFYRVRWHNEANGQEDGGVDPYRTWRNCGSGPSLEVMWRFVDVPLVIGANRILVSANDVGIIGQAAIVITRVPDVAQPQISGVKQCIPVNSFLVLP